MHAKQRIPRVGERDTQTGLEPLGSGVTKSVESKIDVDCNSTKESRVHTRLPGRALCI